MLVKNTTVGIPAGAFRRRFEFEHHVVIIVNFVAVKRASTTLGANRNGLRKLECYLIKN